MMNKVGIFTNDVETTSILNHKLRDNTAEYLVLQGMPRLLDLYERYSVKGTFFFTGYVAKLRPKLVRMASGKGHEIGSHGMNHRVEQAFDILPFDTQVDHLKGSKEILEDICGQEVVSFRAPAARANYNLPRALEEAGFKIDSSVSSQRLDMMFSFGSLKKLNWITAPRLPYFADRYNIFKRGASSILEIPISAFGFPYIGTFMRIAPSLNRLTRYLLYLETLLNHRPFVFLTHPNEFIDEDREEGVSQRRGKTLVSYLLGDLLRHRLKVRNLGQAALPLLERELSFFSKRGFSFVTCRDCYEELCRSRRLSPFH
jgi:peptidoglycan/xylan/chitin deacetylase (PgdA/CDA1 family)